MALQGARRAGKTYTACQWFLLNAYNDGDVILVASMTNEQGRRGAYEDCQNILRSWGEFGGLFDVYKSPRKIECKTKMETYEKKEKRQFNKYDMAIGLFYGVGIFLGIGIFFVGGFMTMSGAGWGASLFGGGCFSLVFGLICHAVITLRRNDK